ncbi:MAG: papain-like cysteine protease family protein [Pyrinomonadaceae bacterium]
MPIIQVAHKHQTKANDCWYACIQMIRSTKLGQKTKAAGADAAYLHRGLLGHRLSTGGSKMAGVMADNNLKDITAEFDLGDINTIQMVLNKYGPFMIGGDYGSITNLFTKHVSALRTLGHYIVVAGTDAATDKVWIHDPMVTGGKWMGRAMLEQLCWGQQYSEVVLVAR